MTLDKSKKRGRPAQLLQIAELHAFVDYLSQKKDRSDLQNDVIAMLRAEKFNFDSLSEAKQILVKEALKPYREHMKLNLLFDEVSVQYPQTAYEKKFVQLFETYRDNELSGADFNILKTMATRYLSFKAHKLELSDLELYLSQIQKKEANKKRTAENHRKFELGGAVLAAFKELGIDISESTPEQVKNRIKNVTKFHNDVVKSKVYQEVKNYKNEYFERNKLFHQVLEGLNTWKKEGELLSVIEIKKALVKNQE
ncbi:MULTISPECIES: hypothetical protein [Acinetobacter]|jgi:hypothetical protein|nr:MULTISPECIES: hypothetical protein [Acinetobacter]MDO7242876.1 hypothetical protein [Acinetobacter baumannii]OTM21914.1 hypothetical protein B9X52_02100 [Acinetobacter pittii]RSZ23210.1 hypothetical protein NDM229_022310 [Acinetobacter bereziniae]